MKIAALADVKAHLSAYVDECENEGRIIITRNGKAAAVLLAPKDNDDLERLMLAHSRRFQSLLNKPRRSIKAVMEEEKRTSHRIGAELLNFAPQTLFHVA